MTTLFVLLLAATTATSVALYSQQRDRTAALKTSLVHLRRTEEVRVAREKRKATAASAALRSARRTEASLRAIVDAPTTTTPPAVALTDPQVLADDLTSAFGQVLGYAPSQAQINAFVTAIHAQEISNARLAQQGEPYVQTDPAAEATAAAQAADPAQALAGREAQFGNILNCMVYPTPGCNGSSGTSGSPVPGVPVGALATGSSGTSGP